MDNKLEEVEPGTATWPEWEPTAHLRVRVRRSADGRESKELQQMWQSPWGSQRVWQRVPEVDDLEAGVL